MCDVDDNVVVDDTFECDSLVESLSAISGNFPSEIPDAAQTHARRYNVDKKRNEKQTTLTRGQPQNTQ